VPLYLVLSDNAPTPPSCRGNPDQTVQLSRSTVSRGVLAPSLGPPSLNPPLCVSQIPKAEFNLGSLIIFPDSFISAQAHCFSIVKRVWCHVDVDRIARGLRVFTLTGKQDILSRSTAYTNWFIEDIWKLVIPMNTFFFTSF
jgi:hypothetical protein